MTILSVAYPLLPVGPDSGGGAEQILFLIDRQLAGWGHRSIVIAARGSQVSGELFETPVFEGEITDQVRDDAQRAHLRRLERARDQYSIDLIHFHGLDFYNYLPERKVPMLATLHLPPSWYPDRIFGLPHIQLNCVSCAQAGAAPGKSLPVIPNGIDTEQFQGQPRERKLLVWLGRICPEKGTEIALRVAHALDLPLVIAGPAHPFRAHENYFTDCVQPLLDEKRKYVGQVGLASKRKLLAEARCVLIPSLVPETSSLVAMEAISSGTPVIAFRSGALPEIVEHGQTGLLVDSEEEMMSAIGKIHEVSSETCRMRARLRFDYKQMVQGYLGLYQKLISEHLPTRCA